MLRIRMSTRGLFALVLGLGSVWLATPAVAAERYVAPSGSSSGACSSGAPCASLERAVALASPGDEIQVAEGSYGPQELGTTAGEERVVVEAAPGATPSFAGLTVRSGNVALRGVRSESVDIASASNVVVQDVQSDSLFIGGGARDVTVKGGSYGGGAPNVAPGKIQGSPPPTNITLDGVLFHDAIRTDWSSHLECLYAADVQQFTVRNSRFHNCAIMDLFITKLSGVNPRDVLIENTFFDRTGSHAGQYEPNSRGYYSLMVANHLDNATNFTVRNNSFAQSMAIDSGSVQNFVVAGNAGPLSACRNGVVYSRNVWSDRRCGPTDKQANPGFADLANYDFHLVPGSAAVDAGDPANAPSTDIDGQARSGAPDAGADEFGAGGASGGNPGTAPAGGAPPASAPSARRRFGLRVRRLKSGRVRVMVQAANHRRVRLVLQRKSHNRWRTKRAWRVRLGADHKRVVKLRVRGKRPARLLLVAGGDRKRSARLR